MCLWKKCSTISEFLDYDAAHRNSSPYIHEKVGNNWNTYTFGDTVSAVRRVARCINKHLMGKDKKHIALFGKNSFYWSVCYLAIMGYSGVCFPIDRQYKAMDLRNILALSELDLFVYDAELTEIIREVRDEFPDTRFLTFKELFSLAGGEPDEIMKTSKEASDPACVLFTSGTSDLPKAVVLSQQNLFSNYDTLFHRTPMDDTDVMLLNLPMNHVYAGVAAFLYSIVSGMQIYFGSTDIDTCAEEFLDVRPTVFITVPLLAEKFCNAAEDRKVGLREFTGGRLKYFYCGGTPVSTGMKEIYSSSGVPIMEAYGLSETSSVVALDHPFDYCEGSVGTIFENLDVMIDAPDDNGYGEILIKGGNVMSGYFKNDELNHAVFTKDGYFKSGDIGRIDEKRRLFITGRKKKVIITQNGKNVYSDELEEYFTHSPISRATVYTNGRQILMKCWYSGDFAIAEEFLLKRNAELPNFKKIAEWELIPDSVGGRLK